MRHLLTVTVAAIVLFAGNPVTAQTSDSGSIGVLGWTTGSGVGAQVSVRESKPGVASSPPGGSSSNAPSSFAPAAYVPPPMNTCTVRPVYVAADYDSPVERSMAFGPNSGNCIYFLTLTSEEPTEGRRQRRRRGPNIPALIALAYDRARAQAAGPEIATAPEAVGLTGLETYIWAEEPLAPITATASAGGVTVTAEARVIEYRWNFGDGQTKVTTHPGRPLRIRGSRVIPGNIEHIYETRGTYDLSAGAIWSARYSINGGPWQPLGYFSTSSERDYPVRQVVAILVRSTR